MDGYEREKRHAWGCHVELFEARITSMRYPKFSPLPQPGATVRSTTRGCEREMRHVRNAMPSLPDTSEGL